MIPLAPAERVLEAIRRSGPFLPGELRDALAAFLTPAAVAVMSGTLAAWLLSHTFGVGEVLDLLLLVAGVLALGLGRRAVAERVRHDRARRTQRGGPRSGRRALCARYWRVALLRYLEEAMAEAYGQLRVKGIAEAFRAVTFPISRGTRAAYVTIGELLGEASYIGTIVAGGRLFTATWSSTPPDATAP